jgi:hypothetical protein
MFIEGRISTDPVGTDPYSYYLDGSDYGSDEGFNYQKFQAQRPAQLPRIHFETSSLDMNPTDGKSIEAIVKPTVTPVVSTKTFSDHLDDLIASLTGFNRDFMDGSSLGVITASNIDELNTAIESDWDINITKNSKGINIIALAPKVIQLANGELKFVENQELFKTHAGMIHDGHEFNLELNTVVIEEIEDNNSIIVKSDDAS